MIESALGDPIALLWVISAALLLIVSALGVREGILDMAALHTNGRRAVAKERMVMQAARVVVALLWLAAGAEALFDARVIPLTFGVATLIASNVILSAAATYSLKKRREWLAA